MLFFGRTGDGIDNRADLLAFWRAKRKLWWCLALPCRWTAPDRTKCTELPAAYWRTAWKLVQKRWRRPACRALRPLPRLRDSTACSSWPGRRSCGNCLPAASASWIPNNAYVDPRVRVGAGMMLLPGTILRGGTVSGTDCQIGPNSMLTDCTVGDGVRINASQCEESVVKRAVRSALMPTCVPTAPWVRRARSVPLSS